MPFSANELVKFRKVLGRDSVFFSCCAAKAGERAWCFADFIFEIPAACLAYEASRASSGAMTKNLPRALGFSLIPTRPPVTFIDWLIFSSALSTLIKQNVFIDNPILLLEFIVNL